MKKYVIVLYIRLSIEDYKSDSMSVENQRLVLNEYAAAMPETFNSEVMDFVDNGYSGILRLLPVHCRRFQFTMRTRFSCAVSWYRAKPQHNL